MGVLADREQAVEVERQALIATPPNTPDRSGVLSNLVAPTCGGTTEWKPADLEQAIEMLRQSLATSTDLNQAMRRT